MYHDFSYKDHFEINPLQKKSGGYGFHIFTYCGVDYAHEIQKQQFPDLLTKEFILGHKMISKFLKCFKSVCKSLNVLAYLNVTGFC